MVVTQHGVTVADIPAPALTDEAPIYQREAREPAGPGRDAGLDAGRAPACPTSTRAAPRPRCRGCSPIRRSPPSAGSTGSTITWSGTAPSSSRAATPASCACAWASGRSSSRSATTATAATASSIPTAGAQIALVECLRNLVCAGAAPLAMTDNLNFGNPVQAGELLPAAGMRPRPGRGLPVLRRAGRGRQCLALQRVARRGDRPDPDRVGGRAHRGRAPHHPPVRPRRRASG